MLGRYRLALPWVAAHKMNFLMLCYSSFPASGKDWRSDYTNEELAGFKELAAEAHSIVVDEAPWAFIVHDLNPRAMSAKVKNFQPAQSWYQDFTKVTVE